jgi:cell division protein FtsW (lipid II flippase)
LMSIGLISLLVVQVFVHIGVNIQLLPNTGLTLPFISYGGTSLMTSVIAVVLLYKILYRSSYKL